MSSSFGTKFILLNDVQAFLPIEVFGGGPWIHLATIGRGIKKYICLKHSATGKTYIEEIDEKEPALFKKIEDDKEWADIYRFLDMHKLLKFEMGKEYKIAKQKK
jgi:hypothetical protein